jgi:hypothetical protein
MGRNHRSNNPESETAHSIVRQQFNTELTLWAATKPASSTNPTTQRIPEGTIAPPFVHHEKMEIPSLLVRKAYTIEAYRQ